jgi:hypothetical protein
MKLSTPRILGILFIAPLFAYGIGNSLKESNPSLGALLIIANSILVVILALLWFPYLAKYSKSIAASYLSARLIEGVLLIIGLKFASWFHLTYQLAMLSLGVGSIFLFIFLLRTKLLSSFWTSWAILGYALLSLGSVLELLGFEVGVLLSIPGGLFELSFGIFLLLSRKPFTNAT